MDAFKPWQFGKLNKIIYVSRGFYCRIKGALRVAACHSLIRLLDLVFQTRKNEKQKTKNKRKQKKKKTTKMENKRKKRKEKEEACVSVIVVSRRGMRRGIFNTRVRDERNVDDFG